MLKEKKLEIFSISHPCDDEFQKINIGIIVPYESIKELWIDVFSNEYKIQKDVIMISENLLYLYVRKEDNFKLIKIKTSRRNCLLLKIFLEDAGYQIDEILLDEFYWYEATPANDKKRIKFIMKEK